MEKKIKEIKKNEGIEPCTIMLLQKWLIIHRSLSYFFRLCLEQDFDQKTWFFFLMWEDECQRFHFHINLIPQPGLYLRNSNGSLNTT